MTNAILKAKLIAFFSSLFVSLSFCTILGIVAFKYWFPGELFWSDGGAQGIKLVLMVDLVLGPVLATVIINPAKPAHKQKLDIICILAAQLAAMFWGYFQIYAQRPVALAFYDGRFSTVSASIVELQDKEVSDLKRFGNTPVWVYADIKKSGAEQLQELFNKNNENQVTLHHKLDYFVKASDKINEIKQESQKQIEALKEIETSHIDVAVAKLTQPGFVAIVNGRYGAFAVLLDDSLAILGEHPIFPEN